MARKPADIAKAVLGLVLIVLIIGGIVWIQRTSGWREGTGKTADIQCQTDAICQGKVQCAQAKCNKKTSHCEFKALGAPRCPCIELDPAQANPQCSSALMACAVAGAGTDATSHWECNPRDCNAGAGPRCSPGGLQTCVVDVGYWSTIPCGTGRSCVDKACIAEGCTPNNCAGTCVNGTCCECTAKDATRCAADDGVELCNGCQWERQPCEAPHVCVDGKCSPPSCNGNFEWCEKAGRCVGKCSEDQCRTRGKDFQCHNFCDPGETCNSGQCCTSPGGGIQTCHGVGLTIDPCK